MGIGLGIWDRSFRAYKKGGFATAERARCTWRALDSFVEKKGWHDVRPETITPKQMRIFLEARAAEISARSVQNEASHLRRAIEGSGRDLGDVRDSRNSWSSERMGIESVSRFGGKRAMSMEVFEEARKQLREDVRACVDLQKSTGLRRAEAIQAGPSLREWSRELERATQDGRGTFLNVRDGCKGGRERCVWVPLERVAEVLQVVHQAQSVSQRDGRIIDVKGLKEAKTIYSYELYRSGLTGDNSGHGLRRAFAQSQYRIYREHGFDERDALARLSRDLGHGDGRGRWVWNNYLAGGEGV